MSRTRSISVFLTIELFACIAITMHYELVMLIVAMEIAYIFGGCHSNMSKYWFIYWFFFELEKLKTF